MVEQMPGGRDRRVVLGETLEGLAHTLSNRFAVAQSVTQRLGSKLAKVGIEELLEDLGVLASAIQGCSEAIKRMQALWRGEIPIQEGHDKDSLTRTQESPERCTPHQEGKGCSRRVLYVEDDSQVRRYIGSALKHAGWLVTAVNDIGDAIEMLYKGTFDIVLTDVRLRSGSGLTLAAHAGRQSPKVSVGILTGWDIAEDLPENVSFVLQKPVSDHILLAALTQTVQIGRYVE